MGGIFFTFLYGQPSQLYNQPGLLLHGLVDPMYRYTAHMSYVIYVHNRAQEMYICMRWLCMDATKYTILNIVTKYVTCRQLCRHPCSCSAVGTKNLKFVVIAESQSSRWQHLSQGENKRSSRALDHRLPQYAMFVCIVLYLYCIGLYWIEMMVRVHPVLLGKSKHGLDHYGSGALSLHT